MENKNLGMWAIGVMVFIAMVFSVSTFFKGSNDLPTGAAGNLLFEDYFPLIRQNGGLNTALSIKTTGNLTVGSSGTALSLVAAGTCSLVSNSSIAATSTGTGTCATTGSVAGDVVMVSLSTTTTKLAAQWVIVGTVATTDSTTVRLLNLTGTAAVPAATNGLGSSTQYQVFR